MCGARVCACVCVPERDGVGGGGSACVCLPVVQDSGAPSLLLPCPPACLCLSRCLPPPRRSHWVLEPTGPDTPTCVYVCVCVGSPGPGVELSHGHVRPSHCGLSPTDGAWEAVSQESWEVKKREEKVQTYSQKVLHQQPRSALCLSSMASRRAWSSSSMINPPWRFWISGKQHI